MPLDALLFDLDGTLVDTNAMHVEAWRRAFDRYGYVVSPDRIFVEVGKGGDQLVPALVGEEADRQDGDDLRDAQPQEFEELVNRHGIRVFNQAVELIEAAKKRGLKTALATSSNESQLRLIERGSEVEWTKLVDAVVHSDDIAESKPNPDPIAAALKKLHLAPGQAALVGDTPYDARAARDGGVVCLGVEAGGHSEQTLRTAGARRVYQNPAELLSKLDEALLAASPLSLRLTEDACQRLMRDALAAAERGLTVGEAPIGCVLARGDGSILTTAHNRQNALKDRTAHAEIIAFREVAGKVPDDANDLILVSTLEPCVMCLGAAMEAAVDTVIYGLSAPADGGTGRVTPPLSPETMMPRVIGSILAAESRALFDRFLERPGLDAKQRAFAEQLLRSTR